MLGEDIEIFSWFQLRFIENPGMAMGIQVIGKLFLSIIRIIASFAIIYYLYLLVKKNYSFGYIVCVAMIFAGAVGNILDSVFYGVIFSESTYFSVATLFPPDGGYGTWLLGKVVDMFYFPLIEYGDFVFFRYIFNLADASISVGIVLLLLFYRDSFSKSFEK
jgi:signal peptidase II